MRPRACPGRFEPGQETRRGGVGQDVPEVGVKDPGEAAPIADPSVPRAGLRVRLTVLGENLVIAISESLVLRIESQDEQQARRRGVDRDDGQLGR